MDTTEIMNELEQDKIIAFCQDKVMFESVKKYLLVYLYQHGTSAPGVQIKGNINWALQLAWDRNGAQRSDEELGADLRAVTRGISIVESGFKELTEVSKPIKPVDEPLPSV